MEFLKIKNWEKYQHYKDRNPPWVKLYHSLLDDYAYGCLQDDSKLLLISLYMVASRTNNKIPADPEWIRSRACIKGKVRFDELEAAGFIEIIRDSKMIAPCKQKACLETETETETETDITPPKKRRCRLPSDFSLTDPLREYAIQKNILPDKVDELFEAFREHHNGHGKMMADWNMAWYTFVRNAPQFSPWAVRQESEYGWEVDA